MKKTKEEVFKEFEELSKKISKDLKEQIKISLKGLKTILTQMLSEEKIDFLNKEVEEFIRKIAIEGTQEVSQNQIEVIKNYKFE